MTTPAPTPQPKKPPQWFTIPAGTSMGQCRSCHAEVFWIVTAANKNMPVSCDYDGAYQPTRREDGQGISHYVNCPDRDKWRKR